MSGSVCLDVCLFVYMCTLPWPDHSRLRSETFIIWLKIYRRRKIMQIWYLPTQCNNFNESTTFNISILHFKIKWMDSITIAVKYLVLQGHFTLKVDKNRIPKCTPQTITKFITKFQVNPGTQLMAFLSFPYFDSCFSNPKTVNKIILKKLVEDPQVHVLLKILCRCQSVVFTCRLL